MRLAARKGFTLLELLIVASLLTVLLAMALPSVTALLNRRQFQDMMGQVEAFLTNERREAGVSAEVCWFRFSSSDRWLISGKLGQPVANSLQLPEDCEFSRSEIVEQLESADLGSLGLEAANLSWSPEFLFFPDGTADEVGFSVKDPNGQEFLIQVRGLTGQVSVQRMVPVAGGLR